MYTDVKIKIEVIYKGRPNKKIDDEIIKKYESPEQGFKWYASGYNFLTKKRDLAFDKTVMMK